MIGLAFIISLVCLIIGLIFKSDILEGLGYLGILIFLIPFVGVLLLSNQYAYSDEKAAIYELENIKIENQILNASKQILKDKNINTEELSTDNIISFVYTIPELQSNKFIKDSLEKYNENNNQILYFKEQKMEKRKYDWLLYFAIDQED